MEIGGGNRIAKQDRGDGTTRTGSENATGGRDMESGNVPGELNRE